MIHTTGALVQPAFSARCDVVETVLPSGVPEPTYAVETYYAMSKDQQPHPV